MLLGVAWNFRYDKADGGGESLKHLRIVLNSARLACRVLRSSEKAALMAMVRSSKGFESKRAAGCFCCHPH